MAARRASNTGSIGTRALRAAALAAAVLLLVGGPGPVRADEELTKFVAEERWMAGEDHYRQAILDAVKEGQAADYKTLADLYYSYNVCRYYAFIGQRPLPEGGKRQLLTWLWRNPEFGMKLMLAINDSRERLRVQPGADDAARIFEMLYQLLAEDASDVARYDQLVIAYLVVWDSRRDATLSLKQSFDFFTSGSTELTYGLRGMPYQLSKYVIDTERALSDLKWAQDNYGGSSGIGRIYEKQWRDNYDTDAFYEGGIPEVSQYPDTLENLRRYEGLCTHAAEFATGVGKAIGVPCVEILGPSESGIGHAWVGYVRPTDGRVKLKWDRESGRIGREDAIVGQIRDPQTGQLVPEHETDLAVLAMGVSESDRVRAGIWLGLGELYMNERQKEPAAAAMEKSLEAGLYDKKQWETYARMVSRRMIASSDASKTAGALARKLSDYPGLAMDAFEAIVWADEGQEVKKRLELCDAMVKDFNRNDYVRARTALLKGHLLEQDEKADEAASAYAAAVEDAMKTGLALELLDNAGRIYVEAKDYAKAIEMYEDAWDEAERPNEHAFVRLTLWFDIGLRLAALAALNGDTREQDDIVSRLARQTGASGEARERLEGQLKRLGYGRLNTTRPPMPFR